MGSSIIGLPDVASLERIRPVHRRREALHAGVEFDFVALGGLGLAERIGGAEQDKDQHHNESEGDGDDGRVAAGVVGTGSGHPVIAK